MFDSEPQFAAMLKDALPRDGAGAVKHGAFGVFVEPNGRVIACSDEHFRAGDMLSIDDSFLRIEPGAGHSGITVLGDAHYAVGASASAGYREYKDARDVYRNDVIALVFSRLCNVEAHVAKEPVQRLSIRSDRTQTGAKEDLATFLVGRRWFAARTGEIVEAIDVADIMPLPFMPPGMMGCLMYRGSPLPVLDLLRVLEPPANSSKAAGARAERGTLATPDLIRGSGQRSNSVVRAHSASQDARERAGDTRPEPGSSARTGQIVVMTPSSGARFGVLVDDLGEIVEVLANRLTPLPAMVANRHMFADSALAPNNAEEGDLVVVLRADLLYDSLSTLSGRTAELSAA